MLEALEDLRSGTVSLREASEKWNVPASTLCVTAKARGISFSQRNTNYDKEKMSQAIKALEGEM